MEEENINKELTITSTAKSPLQLLYIGIMFAGLIFWCWIQFFFSYSTPTIFYIILGIICVLLNLFLFILSIMRYCNKKITLSDKNVTFVNVLGNKTVYSWDDVEAYSYSARGFVLVFKLKDKKVKLFRHYTNLDKIVKKLSEKGKYN